MEDSSGWCVFPGEGRFHGEVDALDSTNKVLTENIRVNKAPQGITFRSVKGGKALKSVPVSAHGKRDFKEGSLSGHMLHLEGLMVIFPSLLVMGESLTRTVRGDPSTSMPLYCAGSD